MGLNDGDETAAYGLRREKGSALYQVETMASIGPAGVTSGALPRMKLSSSQQGLCILVGSQVHLFDATGSTLHATLNLGNLQTCSLRFSQCCLSPDWCNVS